MEAKKILNKSAKQLQFIGSSFHKEGLGVLTVTDSYNKGNNTLFSVHCSVCSNDCELFPEKEMLISKNNLNQGKYPCRCSSGWKPSNYQYKVMVLRFAKQNKDEILDFDEDSNIKVRTKGFKDWRVSANEYLNGKRSLGEAMSNKITNLRKPDNVYIDRFMGGGSFLEGTRFWRSDKRDSRGYYSYWNYICPLCSQDEYVENNLCSGIFTGALSTLSAGSLACRCSQNFKWSQQQREYQLKKILTSESCQFTGWCGKYSGAFSKFNWICSKGHECSTEVSNFIHLMHRCKTCSESVFGFYHERSNDNDFLYLLKFCNTDELFYKIGRTFKPKERFKYFSEFYNIDVVSVVDDLHINVYQKEKYFKKELSLRGYHYTPKESFDGSAQECFTQNILNHSEVVHIFGLKEFENDPINHTTNLPTSR